MGRVTLGVILGMGLVLSGCPAEVGSDDGLDLRGVVLLDGEEDHSDVTVRVFFEDALVETTTTDAQGAFVVRNVPRRGFSLSLSKEGFRSATARVTVVGDALVVNDGQPVSLQPDRSAGLRFVVRSALTGADWSALARVSLSGPGPEVAVTPTPSGEVAVAALRPGTYTVQIDAEGHDAEIFSVFLEPQQELELEPVELRLREDVRLELRVVLSDSEDHSGTRVRVLVEGRSLGELVTDEGGAVGLTTSRLTHTVHLSREGYAAAEGSLERFEVDWVEGEGGGHFAVRGQEQPLGQAPMTLEPTTASLTALVYSDGGARDNWFTFDGAVLRAQTGEGAEYHEQLFNAPDGRGRFQFSGLPPGAYELVVSADGHELFTDAVQLSTGVNEPYRERGGIELRRVVDVALSGRVCRGACLDTVDHSDIRVESFVGLEPLVPVFTAEDGSFSFTTSREEHRLVFSAPGFQRQERTARWDGEGFALDGPVTLQSMATASLKGRVTSPGRAFADWGDRLQVDIIDRDGVTRTAASFNDADAPGSGRFEIFGLVPGTYAVRVSADEHLSETRAVEVDDGENELQEVLLRLASEDEGARVSLRGRACRRSCDGGGGHADIHVKLLLENNEVGSTNTGDSGDFTLPASRGTYQLRLSSPPGTQPRTEEVRWVEDEEGRGGFVWAEGDLSDTPIVLFPNLSASISGRIRSQVPGATLEATLTLEQGQSEPRVATASPTGAFSFANLEPGLLYTLRVELSGHETETLTIPLTDAVALNLGEISMVERRQRVRGLVMTLDDEGLGAVPVPGARVSLYLDGQPDVSGVTDAGGAFVLDALATPQTLVLSAEGFQPRELDLVYDDAGAFLVDGAPLTAATELLMTRQARSDRDGDGVIDIQDNCPDASNEAQTDIDGDGQGDLCDADADADGIINGLDNCPRSSNPMQEDVVGLGRGVTCTLGAFDQPIRVSCSAPRQHLNTWERADEVAGDCGGINAPEVVYELDIAPDDVWSVRTAAAFQTAIYLIDADGEERLCLQSRQLDIDAQALGLSAGRYRLVIDGATPGAAGRLDVSVRSSRACRAVSFDRAEPSLNRDPPRDIALNDYDLDGLLDVVVTPSSTTLEFYKNLGDGELELEVEFDYPNATSFRDLEVADINGDGLRDTLLAYNRSGAAYVSILFGDGGFPWIDVVQRTLSYQGVVGDIATGDVNGDGRLDVIAVDEDSYTITTWLGLGGVEFEAPRLSESLCPDASCATRQVVATDLNSDGVDDVVLLQTSTLGAITTLLGQRDGSLLPTGRFTVAGANARTMDHGDINSDGAVDLVVYGYGDQSINILLGAGDGDFERIDVFSPPNQPRDVRLHDVNDDGHLDLLVSNGENAPQEIEDGAEVLILAGRGDGSFEAPQSFPTRASPVALHIGDMDADGSDDLLVTHAESPGLTLLRARAQAGFSPRVGLFSPGAPNFVAVSDLDRDGALDIIASATGNPLVNVFPNGAHDAQLLPQADRPRSLLVTDVNGDMRPDILTLDRGGGLNLLLSTPFGFRHQLQDLSGYTLNSSVLVAGELTGDDVPDLVLGSATNADVPALHVFAGVHGGEGDVTFVHEVTASTQHNPSSVALADFDGDERLDVALAHWNNASFEVLLNEGAGALTPLGGFPGANSSLSLGVGDLNGDGWPDLITVSRFDSDSLARVALNTGEGGFEAPNGGGELGLPGAARAVEVADLNGDGILDLMIAGNVVGTGEGAVSIFSGRGGGEFDEPLVLEAGQGTSDAQVVDLNDDGLLDVITADQASLELGLLLQLNRTRPGTHMARSSLDPCEEEVVTGERLGAQTLVFPVQLANCRVERLELTLDVAPEARGEVWLRAPRGERVLLVRDAQEHGAGVWRPEVVTELARFESLPAPGVWTLEAEAPLAAAELRINTRPVDPLEAPAPLCGAELTAALCRLPVPEVGQADARRLGSGEGLVLLEGPLGGGFWRGQVIEVRLESEAAADALDVALYAHGARLPLERGVTAPGSWSLSWEVPAAYEGRYLSLRLSAEAEVELSLSVGAALP